MMNRIRWYGPTVVLLVTLLGVMMAGPSMIRGIAYNQTQAEIRLIQDTLERNPTLAELSNAFRKVARVVEPSVVHIEVLSRKRANARAMTPGGPPVDPDVLRRWFREGFPPDLREGLPDLERQPDGRGDADAFEKYNAPRVTANGSGWVYDKQGHIITNNHVVEDGDRIIVRFKDGSKRDARILGADPKTDVAVLKVDGASLHPATLAGQPVEQGDIVFAFGSPLGNEFSMSQGIVSGKGRRIGILQRGRGYENFIQTDAAINPGNSGGPLTNIHGQVIGMNTAIATRTGFYNGIGYAIPIPMVRNVVDQLIDSGKVRRGYLGVFIDDLEPAMAESFGFTGDRGVLVVNPIEDSPAADAGLQRGDIITTINDRPVTSADDLRNLVAGFSPGTRLKVAYFRNGDNRTTVVTIGELPDQLGQATPQPRREIEQPKPSELTMLRKLGLERVTTLDKATASRIRTAATQGVLILEVRDGSVADAAMLRQGHVITHVMGKQVETPKQLMDEIEKHDLKKGVRVSVMMGDQPVFVLLRMTQD